jgi:formate dehydrogenase major subunit
MTRTAAHATDFVRMRPGTDIPVLYGILWHIFKNGWEDKQFIQQRVYGMDEVRAEVDKWTPDEVERVTGIPEAQLKRVAETFAKEKPACLIWAMGQTQHTVGTANVRASCILLMATGNVGAVGNGANPFRGHDNVQGASDMGLDITTLPLYYGLAEGAWKHWCRVWEVDFDDMQKRFENPKMMYTSGIPATRWFDAAMLPKDQIEQKDNIKALLVFGHSPNTFTRIPVAAQESKSSTCLWWLIRTRRIGPYSASARTEPTCCQPAASTRRAARVRLRMDRSKRTNKSSRRFSSRSPTAPFCTCWQRSSVTPTRFSRTSKSRMSSPWPTTILSEINRGGWSTGYSGQSPERLKAHLRNQAKFDPVTLRAPKDDPEVGGDYYGLPWPCWGTPELKHPGTPVLYNTNLHVMEGGGTFRARFGVERDVKLPDGTVRKDNLLAEGSFSVGSEIKDGYPEFTYAVLKKLGWDKDPQTRGTCRYRTYRRHQPRMQSHGPPICPGVSSAWRWRMDAVRTAMPRRVPSRGICRIQSRCIATDLHAANGSCRQVSDLAERGASSACRTWASTCRRPQSRRRIVKQFPLILTSGRLVEYEGGGEESRSNAWLAELQQDMYIELNPADAAERGNRKSHVGLCNGSRDAERQGMPHEGTGHATGRERRDLVPVPLRRLVHEYRPPQQISAGHRSHRPG